MSPTRKKLDPQDASRWITGGREEFHNQSPAQRGIPASRPPADAKPKRERFTVNLGPELIEWARRAVVHTPGLTLAGLVEESLTAELHRREQQQGMAFPRTTLTPKRGRPVTLKD